MELADGTRIAIRPIRPDDKSRVAEGLARLSQETVHRRFLAAKPRFSSSELRYLTEVDGRDHIALVAELADAPERGLIGVARCIRLPDRPHVAEWAIVVADPLQGRGLGRILATRLADAAKAQGIDRFRATTLGDNVAVIRLMGAIAQRFEDHGIHSGVREVEVELAA
jgi:RimJ/RimL family protein N-acetyltransferase